MVLDFVSRRRGKAVESLVSFGWQAHAVGGKLGYVGGFGETLTKCTFRPGYQERVQALAAELQAVGHSKMMLERELQEVISLTGQELEEQREKVLELEDEVGQALLLDCPGTSAVPCAGLGRSPLHSVLLGAVQPLPWV